jgi:hypothetical protein
MEKKHKNEEFKENQTFRLVPNGENQSKSYIEQKLDELKLISDELIKFAHWLWKRNPEDKNLFLKETEAYLIQRVGHGSIGPATAVAEPLLAKKLEELNSIFE